MTQKTNEPNVMFRSVVYLKNLTSMNNKSQLEVVYKGKPIIVGFEWQDPATEASIALVKRKYNDLPRDYLMFLKEVSNGAILYSDTKYGQFGFKLLGAEEIFERQIVWKEYFTSQWQYNFIVFAEWIGDLNVLLFDTFHPSLDATSFTVIEANLLDDVKDWVSPSRSFHEWLDHLIQAQGDIYWHWH